MKTFTSEFFEIKIIKIIKNGISLLDENFIISDGSI